MDAEAALAQCRGPMPAARAIRIVTQIGAALDFAHRNGLWHRDVEPANILLAPGQDDEPERVLLTDFGIAKAADDGQGLTKTGNVIATFDYAPPEQIEGGLAVDHRVDIYALGCVLFKLLTGSVPYPGTTMAAALHGHLNLAPPRPTMRSPWLAPGLDEVIARAMAKDPGQRYPNCRALASAAQAALNAIPEPPPLPYSVSATRAATGAGTQMILGPLDTQDLTPADRDGLVGLVRQARLFDLPATLPAPEAEPDGPPTQPREDASESPGDAITIVVRAGARTAEVSYFPALSPRPPELDNILRGLEDRETWRPKNIDVPAPPSRPPAPVTVVEKRPQIPAFVPPAAPVPEPSSPESRPPAVDSLTDPRRPVRDAPWSLAPPGSPSSPRRPDTPPIKTSRESSQRRRRLVAMLLAGVLIVGAGVTVFILTRDGGGNAAGGENPATSNDAGTDTASETGGQSTPPSSDALGLPNGPPLPSAVLVANQQIDDNLDLYTVDSATGATQTRLTTDAAADFGPVIAPDRTSVVYLREQGAGLELWVVATDGTGARPLFAEPPPGCDSVRRPAWNPADPSMLAVVCVDSAGTATLQLLTAWGGGIRTLETGLPQFDDLAFSPDGRLLVYWANSDPAAGDGRLYTMPNDGSSPPVQLTDGALSGAADAIWSPDGTQIAFRAQVDDGTESNTEIFVMAADGADPRPLAPEVGIDQDPAWSPDGSMIAYKSDRADGNGVRADRLWIMNADGSNSRLLRPGAVADGYAPAWANR